MEESQKLSVFIRAFNVGYFMNKYLPKMFKRFINILEVESELGIAFSEGGKEFEIENEINKLRDIRFKKNMTNNRGYER